MLAFKTIRSSSKKYQIKKSISLMGFYLVTHVDQTWNSVLKGLEQIDVAFDELILDEEQ